MTRPLAKVFFATHLPRAQVPGEITEKMSFKSIFSKVSVYSVANFFTYARSLLNYADNPSSTRDGLFIFNKNAKNTFRNDVWNESHGVYYPFGIT